MMNALCILVRNPYNGVLDDALEELEDAAHFLDRHIWPPIWERDDTTMDYPGYMDRVTFT